MNLFSKLMAVALLAAAGTALAGHGTDTSPRLHLHDDVVRDGQADIVFQGGTALAYWALGSPMGGAAVTASAYAGDAGPGYRVVAVSDFDGDQSADVMWTNGAHLKLWINNGSGTYTSVSVGSYGGGWQPFAAGDINADGKSDLFFRGATHLAYWLMDGASVHRSSYAGDGGSGYHVVAIADFTGRSQFGSASVDVLWSNGSQLKMWVGNPTTQAFQSVALGGYGNGWEPFAAGDINGDTIADILFRGGSHLAYWVTRSVAPLTYESRYAGDGGAGFRAIAASEYGDSGEDWSDLADVLWTNGSQLKLWLGYCHWDWDYGCLSQEYLPLVVGEYGGGWQPLEMLIPRD